jgi:hypothetical protein
MIEERRFILDVLTAFVKDQSERLAIPEDLDWEWTARLVSSHDLGPIFKSVLADQDLPEKVLKQWLWEEQITFVRNTRAMSAAIMLSEILDKASIPSAVIRGLPLAHRLYPSLAARPMDDVDVLIKPQDAKALEAALEKNGYQPAKRLRSQLVYHIYGTVFEIHWSLLTPKRYRESVSSGMLLEDRKILELSEGKIYHLSEFHELIGLVAHIFVHHDLDGFIQLLDIALLAKRCPVNWNLLAEWCQKNRLGRMYLFTLSLVNNLFDLGLDKELELFQNALPPDTERVFQAYTGRLFKQDTLNHYWRRKQNLFFVAESNSIKFRQALRMFAYDELKKFLNAMDAQTRV